MYVYAIRARQYVKIGKSSNPMDRLNALQTGNPVKLHLLFQWKCKSEKHAEQTEYVLHRMFNKFNSHGEWFEYGPIARALELLPHCKTSEEMWQIVKTHFATQRKRRQFKSREIIHPDHLAHLRDM